MLARESWVSKPWYAWPILGDWAVQYSKDNEGHDETRLCLEAQVYLCTRDEVVLESASNPTMHTIARRNWSVMVLRCTAGIS